MIFRGSHFKIRVFLEQEQVFKDTSTRVYVVRVHRVIETTKQAEIYRKPRMLNMDSSNPGGRYFGRVQTMMSTLNTIGERKKKKKTKAPNKEEEGMGENDNKPNQREKERKMLKELKLSISEKRTPTMIKNMAWTTIILLFMMFFIVVFDFTNKSYQNEKLERSVSFLQRKANDLSLSFLLKLDQ